MVRAPRIKIVKVLFKVGNRVQRRLGDNCHSLNSRNEGKSCIERGFDNSKPLIQSAYDFLGRDWTLPTNHFFSK